MTRQPPQTPGATDPIDAVLGPHERDIGAFTVRRILPAAARRSIGPFVFFDHFGPVRLEGESALDVRPHPHIGLATITWLFEGEIRHQDSLGYDQIIRPGEVNWMTAGSGIVHSERSPDSARGVGAPLGGIQSWMALPLDKEEMAPAFHHYGADQMPVLDEPGTHLVLIAGRAFGERSPVKTESETFYAELRLARGHRLLLPDDIEERGLYVCEGSVDIAGRRIDRGNMVALRPGMEAVVRAESDALCMLLGGDALDAPRHLYWNFVSSRRERIEQAKRDWAEGRFTPVPGDPEFIPLPSGS